MYTKAFMKEELRKLGINPKGTLLVHSSYKAIGEVQGRGETVIDALMEYMEHGLLVIPTHTWEYINANNPVYSVRDSRSNVGILTELFRKREGVFRSGHPTHSVAAYGHDAESFVVGDELCDTPCARTSTWGKLLDRKAQIMLLGVNLTKNTYIHGIEEWLDIPGRLTDTHEPLKTVLMDGREVSVPSRRHCGVDWSSHFWKVDTILVNQGIMTVGKFGDAETRVCDAKKLFDLLRIMLKDHPNLFSDNEPLSSDVITYYSNIQLE